MDDLHISLLATGLATFIGLWLGARCILRRYAAGAAHGDGGDGLLARRMRAQANFIEYTPLALGLVLALDLAGQDRAPAGRWALGLAALAFLAGRVLHALGMESPAPTRARKAGMALTLLVLPGLAGWAIAAGLQRL